MTGRGRIIGVFGGTFDPIHNGHLGLLDAVLERLPVDVIHVVPAGVPPLRSRPEASAEHRLNMVRMALEGRTRLICDTREIEREGTSYTVLTLETLSRESPGSRLLLILGRDAFDTLPKWHRAPEIRQLADIVVINRPGYPALDQQSGWLAGEAMAATVDPLAPAGRIVALEVPPSAVSATSLRQSLAAGEDVSGMLPPKVLDYIKRNRLYG